MAEKLSVDDAVTVTIAQWIVRKNKLNSVLTGKVRRVTEKAILLEGEFGSTWIPKVAILNIGDNKKSEEDSYYNRTHPWVVDEHEGSTNRLVSTHRFETKEEAKKTYDEFKALNKFAGVGGQWTHYYTVPRLEKTI